MAKRKSFKDNADDPFDVEGQQSIDSSWTKTDSMIFGALSDADARADRTRIREFDIFSIYPDPLQPRRAIPSRIRQSWNGDPNTVGDIFGAWLQAIETEERGGGKFPLDDYLMERDIEGDDSRAGPLELAFLEIINLAVSIRRDALTNPITIVQDGAHLKVETGERRWLAYHLLHELFDDETDKWRKIPARKVSELDVWRQASENNARQNLNAIGRARQFAILMMDLWRREGKRFKAMGDFNTDQEYYAQVQDMSPPHGQSGLILSAMGFKNRNAIYRHRQLLTLPSEIWQRADDTSCPEGVLRDIVGKPFQIALEMYESWERGEVFTPPPNVTSGDKSDESDISQTRKQARPTLLGDPACRRGNRLFTKEKEQKIALTIKELVSLRSGVGQAKSQTKAQIRHLADDIRRFLEDVERSIDDV